jgi:putative transposase
MSPRPLRIQAPGAIYHAFAQATGTEMLYRDAVDRDRFLSIVSTTVAKYSLELHFFVLLGTHHHLVLTTPAPNMSAAMQYLNGLYCRTYNGRHARRGHVLGGRYGTKLLESERHAAWLVPYLALNPVRAGLVERPEDWRWSSYASLIGLSPAWSFVDPSFVLEQFGSDPARARADLRAFVEDVLAQDAGTPLTGERPDHEPSTSLSGVRPP